MNVPNKADAPNAAMALLFHSEHYWRGVGDLRRWAYMKRAAALGFRVSIVGCLIGCASGPHDRERDIILSLPWQQFCTGAN
jgi:hypothetical protein